MFACEGYLCGGGGWPGTLPSWDLVKQQLGLPVGAFFTSTIQKQVRYGAVPYKLGAVHQIRIPTTLQGAELTENVPYIPVP